MNEVILNSAVMPVVTDCGLLAAAEPFYHMDRTADYDVLIYVTEGAIYVTEDGIDYEINPGELLFLKHGLRHFGKREIRRGTTWYFFHYRADIAPSDAGGVGFVVPKKLKGLRGGGIELLIKNYIDFFWSEDERRPLFANSRFYELLARIAVYKTEEKSADSLAEQISAYLRENYSAPFSASALESEFFLSYKHMAAVYKRERGITMQQYHTRFRMSVACRLLKSTLMSIGEIAAAIGYKDALYFSKCFRAAQGVSPSEYRKSSRSYL